ncbi:MAG: insulinase family protein [bacterium]
MNIFDLFELVREEAISELKARALLLRHVRTGAEVLSIENDDENKVFGIAFRTPPDDSTGVAHILEHSVLCGSRKYPVKEPFVELLKGSLKTFLNAMTYPDKTCYPVASQNLQDLRNLTDVYLDAVFHPRITPQTLQQEGWHYEPGDRDGDLKIVGVVYNEMKGSYSSPDRLLAQYSQESLFPDHPYGLDSGGHPRHIPSLTYERFKRFHDTYYHPSNARVFFYGDDKTEDRLQLLEEYLEGYTRLEIDSRIPRPPRFDRPRNAVLPYDPGQESAATAKAMVTLNWLLPETLDAQTYLAMEILSHVLIGTPGSPLRKALIDSGIGEDLAGVGLENELRQMYFSTGLKGVAEQDIARVEPLVLDTLGRLARDGVDPMTVQASVNTVEFRLRENNTGSFPRGLALMLRSLTTWLYGGDPLTTIRFEAPLAALKERVSRGRFFEGLIEEHLLGNPHRSTVTLKPEPGLASREEAEERERLARIRAGMSPEELAAIAENARELKRMQGSPDPPEALATIPTLQLSDLPRRNKTIPMVLEHRGETRIAFHDLFTNGIVYLDLAFDLHQLPRDLIPYVPLFGRSLVEMGTAQEDFVRLSQRIGSRTGGIRPSTFAAAICGSDASAAWLLLRGKATLERSADLVEILRDVLRTVRLDNRERFRQMVLDEKAGLEAQLVPAGHGIVGSRLASCFNEAGWVTEQMSGVSSLFFLRRLAAEIETAWEDALGRLEEIRRCLINRNGLVCNVTTDQASWGRFQPTLAALLDELPAAAFRPQPWSLKLGGGFEGLAIPAKVNFVGKAANLYELGYRFHGSAIAITRYLRTTWLWDRIRVQGGAYGAFCGFDRRSGFFSLLSYRDPNLLGTLQNYDGAARFLREAGLDGDEVRRAVIGAIGELDAHELPDAKGVTSLARYLTGDSEEARQRMRDEILSLEARDFGSFSEFLERFNEQAKVVVMGSREALEEALETRGRDWLEIVQVL